MSEPGKLADMNETWPSENPTFTPPECHDPIVSIGHPGICKNGIPLVVARTSAEEGNRLLSDSSFGAAKSFSRGGPTETPGMAPCHIEMPNRLERSVRSMVLVRPSVISSDFTLLSRNRIPLAEMSSVAVVPETPTYWLHANLVVGSDNVGSCQIDFDGTYWLCADLVVWGSKREASVFLGSGNIISWDSLAGSLGHNAIGIRWVLQGVLASSAIDKSSRSERWSGSCSR